MVRRVGVLYPWPGATENGEYEIIKRLQAYFKDKDVIFDIISNEGILLGPDVEHAGSKMADGRDYDFIISAHYSSRKVLDAYHYHLLWNPTEFLFHRFSNPVGLKTAVTNILSCDDFLASNSEGLIERLRFFAEPRRIDLEGLPKFFPSAPDYGFRTDIKPDFRIFYCGINWDAHRNDAQKSAWNRFYQMFRDLDDADVMSFHGPEEVAGRKPWDGFDSYRGSLPFDGISLIRRINRCGVGLALMSRVHHDTGGLLSSRVYEILAAGGLVISHPCAFLKETFGDNVLYIDFDEEDPANMARQVIAHAEWIRANLEEANAKARAAQAIWLEQLSYDRLLPALFAAHPERVAKHHREFGARSDAETIDVVTFVGAGRHYSEVERVARTLSHQSYQNWRLKVVCDPAVETSLRALLGGLPELYGRWSIQLHPIRRVSPQGQQPVPSGELVARALGDDLAEYVAFIDPGVEWMSDHLDTLKRALEDSPNALMAYSGTLKRVADTIVHTVFDGQFDAMEQIAELGDFTFRGNLLLRRALVRQIPPWLLGQFRWREALAYFTLAQARGRAVATLRQTATIIDGGGLFQTGSDEDRERETAILLELMPPEQLRLRQLYATTGVMRAPAPAAIYDVDRAPPAEIADLIDRAQSASAAPSVLASLRSATQIRKARAAARARDWSGAAAAYQRALRALPHQPKAWVQFGHALKEGGDRDAAEAAYREAVRLRPRSSDTHLQLGHLLKIQGRTAEAAQHYRTALALDPRSTEAGREAQLLGVA